MSSIIPDFRHGFQHYPLNRSLNCRTATTSQATGDGKDIHDFDLVQPCQLCFSGNPALHPRHAGIFRQQVDLVGDDADPNLGLLHQLLQGATKGIKGHLLTPHLQF